MISLFPLNHVLLSVLHVTSRKTKQNKSTLLFPLSTLTNSKASDKKSNVWALQEHTTLVAASVIDDEQRCLWVLLWFVVSLHLITIEATKSRLLIFFFFPTLKYFPHPKWPGLRTLEQMFLLKATYLDQQWWIREWVITHSCWWLRLWTVDVLRMINISHTTLWFDPVEKHKTPPSPPTKKKREKKEITDIRKQTSSERCGTFTGGMNHIDRKSEKARVEDKTKKKCHAGSDFSGESRMLFWGVCLYEKAPQKWTVDDGKMWILEVEWEEHWQKHKNRLQGSIVLKQRQLSLSGRLATLAGAPMFSFQVSQVPTPAIFFSFQETLWNMKQCVQLWVLNPTWDVLWQRANRAMPPLRSKVKLTFAQRENITRNYSTSPPTALASLSWTPFFSFKIKDAIFHSSYCCYWMILSWQRQFVSSWYGNALSSSNYV